MARYFCRSCNFRYEPRGTREPIVCPACGKNNLTKDYSAADILKEVTGEGYLE